MAALPFINKESLVFGEELGSGSFGAVWKAEWRGEGEPRTVAVKRVLLLQKEAAMLNTVRHRNIIQFYGISQARPDFYIVTEYAPGGSLKKYLANRENPDLEFDHILAWALDIIMGVRYLHFEAPTPTVHRDLKSDNVVISADNVCKLCDFGTAKPAGVPNTSVAGTVPWMSPEMILNKEVGMPSDIYSYAVIVWEMVTREVPFKGMNEFLVSMMVVEQDVRLKIPSTCPEQLRRLIAQCWEKTPDSRPNSSDIFVQLSEMRGDRGLSAEAEKFLADKADWLTEIREQTSMLQAREKDLDSKELMLHRKLRHEFAKSAINNVPRYDILLWDEDDVASWLKSLDVKEHEVERLSKLIKQHYINGERLLMLTGSDLDRLSVPLGTQMIILNARDRVNQERLRLQNFPPLLETAPEAAAKKRPASRNITLSLLTGIYFRQVITRNSSGPHERWKPFVDLDIDAIEEFEHMGRDPACLIRDVTFCFTNPHPKDPYRVAAGPEARLPLVPPEWMIGLHDEEVGVVVNYADSLVLKPRNTRLQLSVSRANAGRCAAKQVDLTVRLPTIGSGSSTSVGLRPMNVSPSTDNIWEVRSAANLNSLFPPRSEPSTLLSSPNLLGPTPYSAPANNKSPMWSKIAEGIRYSPATTAFPVPKPRTYSSSHLPPVSPSRKSEMQSEQIKRADSESPGDTRKKVTFGVVSDDDDDDIPVPTNHHYTEAVSLEDTALGQISQRRSSDEKKSGVSRPKSFSLTPSYRGGKVKQRSPRATVDQPKAVAHQRGGVKKRGRYRLRRSQSDGVATMVDGALSAAKTDLSPLTEHAEPGLDRSAQLNGVSPKPTSRLPVGPMTAQPPTNSACPRKTSTSNLSAQVYGGNQKWMWIEEEEDQLD